MSSLSPSEDGALSKKLKVNGKQMDDSGIGLDGNSVVCEADSSSDPRGNQRGAYDWIAATANGDKNANQQNLFDGEADPLRHAHPEIGDEPSTSAGQVEPLQNMLDHCEPQFIDEKTTRQMEDIENKVKETPLISSKEPLDVLLDEYSDDIYIQKIMDLQSKYKWLRRARGDGNCFYRSLGLSLFENMMRSGDRSKVDAFKHFMVECKDGLVAQNYPKFTMEDFCDNFNEQLETLMNNPSEDQLLTIFQMQSCSDFIIAWLRFLTVLQLQRDPDFYMNFIENHASVKDFCRNEVEPMYRESDHIHIIAIATLLNMKIRVEYMDRGSSSSVVGHDFPENDASAEIFMLYRPGHYDILYPVT